MKAKELARILLEPQNRDLEVSYAIEEQCRVVSGEVDIKWFLDLEEKELIEEADLHLHETEKYPDRFVRTLLLE